MPYGLSNYNGEQPGSEYLSDNPEMQAANPQAFIPQRPAGKKGGRSNLWAAVAAPIIAALGSKMSGGQMSFGDAFAALGTGFAGEKYRQLRQRQQAEFDEGQRTIDQAHQAVQGLSKLTPETMAKFPRLQQLAQKYSDALADDGKVSTKEAADIIVQYRLAQADMASAGQAQGLEQGAEEAKAKAKAAEEAQYQTRMTGLERELPPMGEMGPETPESRQGSLSRMYNQAYGHFSVPVSEGQDALLGADQALPYMRVKERQDRSKKVADLAERRVQLEAQRVGLSGQRFNYAQQRDLAERVTSTALRLLGNEELGLTDEHQAVEMAWKMQNGVSEKIGPRPAISGKGVPGDVDFIWQNGKLVPATR